jgi:RNA ligase
MSEFQEFPKMARWSRDIVITEKIDGTNAAVLIVDGLEGMRWPGAIAKVRNLDVFAQSRTRFITPEDDNYGFARWVVEHAEELCARGTGLGEGRHFGEWWGSGCQRGYDLPKGEKRFSLFNTSRWDEARPACCHVVPTLYAGPMNEEAITGALNALHLYGSRAAPGFMDPEGIVIFHTAANFGFKKTLKKDEVPKSMASKGTAVSA